MIFEKHRINNLTVFVESARNLVVINALAVFLAIPQLTHAAAPLPSNELLFISNWSHSHTGDGNGELGSEIVSYDKDSNRVFVTNASQSRLDILDGSTGISLGSIALGGLPNSVDTHSGIVAVAVEAVIPQNIGTVQFYQATSGTLLNTLLVGALPDMLVFTADGSKILVANEGEPDANYSNDPEGSISIIDISSGVTNATVSTVSFGSFNSQVATLKSQGVRIFGPGATVAQDLEPEYIAINSSDTQAYVSLQENNAIAVVDIISSTVTDIRALGTKDHSLPGNEFDASNKDGLAGNFQNWPVTGLYQPDALVTFEINGEAFYATANEGDSRNYDGYSEQVRIGNATIDPVLDTTLNTSIGNDWQDDAKLGRLWVSTVADTDGDSDIDQLQSFGTRSFSIWRQSDGSQIYDSGALIDLITLDAGSYAENRSDDKGPEPESVVFGNIDGKNFIFIGNERTNDILVFNVNNPFNPAYVTRIASTNDFSPEGMKFVSATKSADGTPFLLVSNEVSSTTRRYNLSLAPDADNDGVPDITDNCVTVANNDQRDTDSDGFGNICDADLDNDGLVGFSDFGLFRSVFGQAGASSGAADNADLDGDGLVGFSDFGLFRSMFGLAPGS
jgi:hypothetical protein